jgi:hypothetical protein
MKKCNKKAFQQTRYLYLPVFTLDKTIPPLAIYRERGVLAIPSPAILAPLFSPSLSLPDEANEMWKPSKPRGELRLRRGHRA